MSLENRNLAYDLSVFEEVSPKREKENIVNLPQKKIREKRSTGQFHHLLVNSNRFFSRKVTFCDNGTIGCDRGFVVVIKCILVILVEDEFSRFITSVLSFPIFFYEVKYLHQ